LLPLLGRLVKKSPSDRGEPRPAVAKVESMPHTTEQWLDIARSYYALDKGEVGPARHDNPEGRKQREAHVRACDKYREWLAFLERIDTRFPGRQVENRSIFRQGPNTSIYDLAYAGTIDLATRNADERYRYLGFMVSIVIPCYVVYHLARLTDNEERVSFVFDGDDLPLAGEIGSEIEATFPGYAPLPEDEGSAIVPGVRTALKPAGTATVYDCLLSDHW
jgi:hypothetical protein